MQLQPWLYTFNHWIHLTAAIIALGGMIFLRAAVLPALKELNDEARAAFMQGMRRKVMMLTIHAVALLFVTGMINIFRALSSGVTPLYGILLTLKILLAFVLFAFALMLVIPSEALEKFQEKRDFWLRINILIGLAVVLISATIRLLPTWG